MVSGPLRERLEKRDQSFLQNFEANLIRIVVWPANHLSNKSHQHTIFRNLPWPRVHVVGAQTVFGGGNHNWRAETSWCEEGKCVPLGHQILIGLY